MISIDAGILYAAVNARSPRFKAARALVERLSASTEVVVAEQVLIQLYGALRQAGTAEAARVIRFIRRNRNWRVVDVQSGRVQMNAVWDAVFANGEDLATIRRRRLIATLRQNGVPTVYTDEAAAYRALGFDVATDPYAGSASGDGSVPAGTAAPAVR